MTHLPLSPYSRFPTELASILLLCLLTVHISYLIIAMFVFKKIPYLPKRAQYMTHPPLSPYSRFPTELATILLLCLLTVHISYLIIAMLVFRKPLFIN
jgi:uncharacterized membrane protein